MKFALINITMFCLLFSLLPLTVTDWQFWSIIPLAAAINISGFIEGRLE